MAGRSVADERIQQLISFTRHYIGEKASFIFTPLWLRACSDCRRLLELKVVGPEQMTQVCIR